jgi:hypothetical protein
MDRRRRNMSLSRSIELVAGSATAVAQIVALVMLGWRDFSGEHLINSLVVGLLFFVLPGLAVLVGCYVHVIQGKRYGRTILVIGVLIVCGLGFFGLAVDLLYSYNHRLVGVIALPSLTALIACLASFTSGATPSDNSQRRAS